MFKKKKILVNNLKKPDVRRWFEVRTLSSKLRCNNS